MRLSRLSAVAMLAGATVAITAASTPVDQRGVEVKRIRAHFDSVLVELSPETAGLSALQRARRSGLLVVLRQYRDAGVFPHNYDFPGEAVPYFVDRKTGTLCAVANLLAVTGRRDIVDRVARADNNVRVAQLAGDTAFTSWLAANGLTLDEAARIQVPYVVPSTDAEVARDLAFITIAPISLGISAVTSIMNVRGNVDGHRRFVSALGVGSGAVAIAASALAINKSEIPRSVQNAAAAAAVAGGLGVFLSSRSILHHRSIVASQREAERQRSVARASIAPIVMTGSRARTGLSVSISY